MTVLMIAPPSGPDRKHEHSIRQNSGKDWRPLPKNRTDTHKYARLVNPAFYGTSETAAPGINHNPLFTQPKFRTVDDLARKRTGVRATGIHPTKTMPRYWYYLCCCARLATRPGARHSGRINLAMRLSLHLIIDWKHSHSPIQFHVFWSLE